MKKYKYSNATFTVHITVPLTIHSCPTLPLLPYELHNRAHVTISRYNRLQNITQFTIRITFNISHRRQKYTILSHYPVGITLREVTVSKVPDSSIIETVRIKWLCNYRQEHDGYLLGMYSLNQLY